MIQQHLLQRVGITGDQGQRLGIDGSERLVGGREDGVLVVHQDVGDARIAEQIAQGAEAFIGHDHVVQRVGVHLGHVGVCGIGGDRVGGRDGIRGGGGVGGHGRFYNGWRFHDRGRSGRRRAAQGQRRNFGNAGGRLGHRHFRCRRGLGHRLGGWGGFGDRRFSGRGLGDRLGHLFGRRLGFCHRFGGGRRGRHQHGVDDVDDAVAGHHVGLADGGVVDHDLAVTHRDQETGSLGRLAGGHAHDLLGRDLTRHNVIQQDVLEGLGIVQDGGQRVAGQLGKRGVGGREDRVTAALERLGQSGSFHGSGQRAEVSVAGHDLRDGHAGGGGLGDRRACAAGQGGGGEQQAERNETGLLLHEFTSDRNGLMIVRHLIFTTPR
ncbi:hypothetical protein DEMA109039_13055 [Deinococcus marmoris]